MLLGQSRLVPAVQPLELTLCAAEFVDHLIGKCGKEFVSQRRMPSQDPVAGIMLHLHKKCVRLNGASALAPASINQRDVT